MAKNLGKQGKAGKNHEESFARFGAAVNEPVVDSPKENMKGPSAEKPISLAPLEFEEALTGLLSVKPLTNEKGKK